MADLSSHSDEEQGSELLCQLDSLLAEAALDLRAAIELSLVAGGKDPHARRAVAAMWEDMLGSFYGYTRQKKRDTGINIMSWVSFANVVRR